ncbi:MAG: hypothetical protein JW874_02975 [Spirochaetales bacterium]|nr:hypothetical protein [Spirochaetales bacterium]
MISRFKPVIIILFILPGLFVLQASRPADNVLKGPDAKAEIVISISVAAANIEAIGTNLSTVTGGTNFASNNFIFGSGMEPAIIRFLVRVERSGPGWIEWDRSLGGVHMWELNYTGFGDGAEVKLYRISDNKNRPISWGGMEDFHDPAGADHVIFLGQTSVPEKGWIAEGENKTNRVYLKDKSIKPVYGDYAFITVKKLILKKNEVNSRLYEWFVENDGRFWLPDGAKAQLVYHDSVLPSAFTDAGESCLKIEVKRGSEGWVGQYLFHHLDDGEGQWYSQLEPGVKYRARVWLKQEGMKNGRVRFQAQGPYEGLTQESYWKVTDSWQLFTYDFYGPDYWTDGWHGGFGLEIAEPGTLWMDNFVVFRYDAEHDYRPFGPHTLSFSEIMASFPQTGPKPAVRFYPVSYATHSDMEHFLSDYPNSSLDFIYNVQSDSARLTIPQVMDWAYKSGDSPENRIVPWLTISEEYTETEWIQLVEYLAVPYDPARDSEKTKPWAYLRWKQRGTGKPWTDEFREILLEMGNETWHQGAGGYGWNGFGSPGWVHFGGLEYGLFARYIWQENVMKQDWWSKYALEDKIHFVLNANYEAYPESYGEIASQQVKGVPVYIGHANYVGPKWETGEEPQQLFDDHGMQETLVGAWTNMYDLIEQAAETRDALDGKNLAEYQIIAYEGGASGYYVPGMGTDRQTAVSQLYGKSLGMAVAALDTWLYSSLNGYKYQEQFCFASGDNWTSHTMPRQGGFIPHTGWLALRMRNLYAEGNQMLEVSFKSVPSYTREGVKVPLLTAYAINSENSLSVFVLSRKLDGKHDGINFGDGTTPVSIQLPDKSYKSVTRYTLSLADGSPADPGLNNIDGQKIFITSEKLGTSVVRNGKLDINENSGGIKGGMPPGTVFLYVFEK